MFDAPYIGIDVKNNIAVLYNRRGDFSVILRCENPIIQYSADIESYYEFHTLFSNIIKILGTGCTIQKQDIFCKKRFISPDGADNDYLANRYFDHFNNRIYTDITTYITITRELNKSKFLAWDDKEFDNYLRNIEKVLSLIKSKGIKANLLNKKEIQEFIVRFLSVNFNEKTFGLRNIKTKDEYLKIGEKNVQSISLVDIDEVNFPAIIKPYKELNVGLGVPVDLFSFLHETPDIETLVYNQVINIPDQRTEAAKLEAKKKSIKVCRIQQMTYVLKILQEFKMILQEKVKCLYMHTSIYWYQEKEI